MEKYKNIDEYISSFPKETQEILIKLRKLVKETAPEATEAIVYGMPTFRLNGNLVHFAGYKNHIGFYPTPTGITAFEKELAPYKTGKGTIRFDFNKPIPYELVKKVVEARVKENLKS